MPRAFVNRLSKQILATQQVAREAVLGLLMLGCATLVAPGIAKAQPQPRLDRAKLKADFEAIDRCAQAARLVVKAAELARFDKAMRTRFTDDVLRSLRETNQLGNMTPSEADVFMANVDDLLDQTNPVDPQARDILLARSASRCTLFSIRGLPSTKP